MSETANAPLDLNIDLSSVETARPVLPAGNYVAIVKAMEKQENKAKTGFNLVVHFATVAPTTSIKGSPVDAGFQIIDRYPLQPSQEKPDSNYWQVKLAQLQDAATGSSDEHRPAFNPQEILGKQVLLVLDVESSDEYGDQNRVKRVLQLRD